MGLAPYSSAVQVDDTGVVHSSDTPSARINVCMVRLTQLQAAVINSPRCVWSTRHSDSDTVYIYQLPFTSFMCLL